MPRSVLTVPVKYSALLAEPPVLRVGLPSVLARLPLGMTTLAVLLLVHQSEGSFGMAGSATACFALASGASSPLRGRAVDRIGAAPVLVVTGLLQPAALVGLVAACTTGMDAAVLVAAGVAGALLPPVGPVARVLWQRLPTGAQRQAAYSLDAVVLQVIYYAGGPPLVTGLIVLGSPAFAVAVIAALTLVGTLLVAAAPSVRGWPRPAESAPLLGALAARGVAGVLLVVVVSASAIGALEVAVIAFAADHGAANLGGLLLAVLGIGSIAGGLWYGSRPGHALSAGYRRCLVALTIGFVPLFAAPDPVVLAALLLIAGLAIAPASVAQFGMIGALAPARSVTEAFTWLLSASQAGTAAGTGLAGIVTDLVGAPWVLLLPVTLAAAAVALSLAATNRG